MRNPHESERLNALCGKHVKIVFYDDTTDIGILHKDTLATKTHLQYLDNTEVIGYYIDRADRQLGEVHFKKSHIKKISEDK